MLNTLVKVMLKILPNPLGIRLLRTVAGQTKPLPIPEEVQAMLSKARTLTLGSCNNIRAWEWGHGPLVILVHGWGGQASQMAPLASEITRQGFRCVIFDVSGHGNAPENKTQWDYFIRDITDVTRSLNEKVYAYIGHSAGGMTMMAARKLGRIEAEKYMCICAPSYPFPPIRAVQQKLNPRKSLLDLYKTVIGGQFEIPWSELESSGYYSDPRATLSLVYDEKDRFVPHTEGDKIHALCPGSSLFKTKDYGHTRILNAPELRKQALEFLTTDEFGQPSPSKHAAV
ncbi:MAG: alpha/beta fold hydrolase [Sneathiella sp.]